MKASPVTLDGMAVTPLVEVRLVRLGPRSGGLAVTALRPKALEVRYDDGRLELLKIPDPTRWTRLAMIVALAAALLLRRKSD